MGNSSYTIRNYQPADFNRFVLLNTEAENLEPTGRDVSARVIADNLGRPNYSPEQDLFVVEIGGEFVGYMDIRPELAIGRVVLNCWVHPEYRRRGLATKFLGYAIRRARELRVKVIHTYATEDNAVAESVLSKLGFKYVRRFLKLRLDMAEVSGQEIAQDAFQCRHLQRGEEHRLTQIQNRSFADTWGYNPNTVEEIVYLTNSYHCSPEDVVLVCDGDNVIGYCWTRATRDSASDKREAQIFMLGVDPDYRGRRVGKTVLLAGLSHLANRGFQVAELTVDSENKVACALYRSVGFRFRTSSLWYEKVIE